jgi:hypothetical protein
MATNEKIEAVFTVFLGICVLSSAIAFMVL